MSIEFGVPFVTRALPGVETQLVARAFENEGAVGSAGGFADIGPEHVANARQWLLWIERQRRQNLSARHPVLILFGVHSGGGPQLPKLVDAHGIVRLCFGPI